MFTLEIRPEGLLDGVALSSEIQPGDIGYIPELRFMARQGLHSGYEFFGFHADEYDRDLITPQLTAEERPGGSRSLDDNAKGYAVALGNSQGSVDTMYQRAGRLARYGGLWKTPEILSLDIVNIRHKDSTAKWVMARGIARHGIHKALVQAKLESDDRAIRRLQKPYGDADIAFIDPAPTWIMDQHSRGVEYAVIPPVWAMYRDSARRPLRRVGQYDLET